MENYLARLYQALVNKQPSPVMVGAGGAAQAGQLLQNLPYQRYVQEAQAMGDQPMDQQTWMAQQGQQRTAY